MSDRHETQEDDRNTMAAVENFSSDISSDLISELTEPEFELLLKAASMPSYDFSSDAHRPRAENAASTRGTRAAAAAGIDTSLRVGRTFPDLSRDAKLLLAELQKQADRDRQGTEEASDVLCGFIHLPPTSTYMRSNSPVKSHFRKVQNEVVVDAAITLPLGRSVNVTGVAQLPKSDGATREGTRRCNGVCELKGHSSSTNQSKNKSSLSHSNCKNVSEFDTCIPFIDAEADGHVVDDNGNVTSTRNRRARSTKVATGDAGSRFEKHTKSEGDADERTAFDEGLQNLRTQVKETKHSGCGERSAQLEANKTDGTSSLSAQDDSKGDAEPLNQKRLPPPYPQNGSSDDSSPQQTDLRSSWPQRHSNSRSGRYSPPLVLSSSSNPRLNRAYLRRRRTEERGGGVLTSECINGFRGNESLDDLLKFIEGTPPAAHGAEEASAGSKRSKKGGKDVKRDRPKKHPSSQQPVATGFSLSDDGIGASSTVTESGSHQKMAPERVSASNTGDTEADIEMVTTPQTLTSVPVKSAEAQVPEYQDKSATIEEPLNYVEHGLIFTAARVTPEEEEQQFIPVINRKCKKNRGGGSNSNFGSGGYVRSNKVTMTRSATPPPDVVQKPSAYGMQKTKRKRRSSLDMSLMEVDAMVSQQRSSTKAHLSMDVNALHLTPQQQPLHRSSSPDRRKPLSYSGDRDSKEIGAVEKARSFAAGLEASHRRAQVSDVLTSVVPVEKFIVVSRPKRPSANRKVRRAATPPQRPRKASSLNVSRSGSPTDRCSSSAVINATATNTGNASTPVLNMPSSSSVVAVDKTTVNASDECPPSTSTASSSPVVVSPVLKHSYANAVTVSQPPWRNADDNLKGSNDDEAQELLALSSASCPSGLRHYDIITSREFEPLSEDKTGADTGADFRRDPESEAEAQIEKADIQVGNESAIPPDASSDGSGRRPAQVAGPAVSPNDPLTNRGDHDQSVNSKSTNPAHHVAHRSASCDSLGSVRASDSASFDDGRMEEQPLRRSRLLTAKKSVEFVDAKLFAVDDPDAVKELCFGFDDKLCIDSNRTSPHNLERQPEEEQYLPSEDDDDDDDSITVLVDSGTRPRYDIITGAVDPFAAAVDVPADPHQGATTSDFVAFSSQKRIGSSTMTDVIHDQRRLPCFHGSEEDKFCVPDFVLQGMIDFVKKAWNQFVEGEDCEVYCG